MYETCMRWKVAMEVKTRSNQEKWDLFTKAFNDFYSRVRERERSVCSIWGSTKIQNKAATTAAKKNTFCMSHGNAHWNAAGCLQG